MEETFGCNFCIRGWLLLLKTLTGIGMDTEPGGGSANARILKICPLKQQAGGRLADLTIQPAHNAGERNRLAFIPDHQIFRDHVPRLAVKRRELARCSKRGDADSLEAAPVEGVHGLAEFKHDVIGEIDQNIECALSQSVQPVLQRQG